jgi:membrane associated rhomboid family serine protease
MPLLLPIIVVTACISIYAMNRPEVLRKMMLSPYKVVHDNAYYRILTHGFIHADGMHLAINLFVLWEFGSVVEMEFGAEFPFLYFGAIIAASIPAIVKHKNNINYNSLGASGAVSAVLMAFIVAHPSHTLLLFFVIPIPAILAGLLFFIFERSMQKRGGTGIAHDAHIYGAGFGLIYALIKNPNGLSNMFSALTGLF